MFKSNSPSNSDTYILFYCPYRMGWGLVIHGKAACDVHFFPLDRQGAKRVLRTMKRMGV